MSKARDLADSADKDIAGTIVLDDITLSNDMSVADNGKVIFGNDADLEILYDTTNSIIKTTNTHSFKLMNGSSDYITATPSNAVILFHNGLPKLSTAAGGANVTGTLTAGSGITVTNGTSDFSRTHSTTTSSLQILDLKATSAGNMADGFGPSIHFSASDTGTTSNQVAEINAVRAGSDTTFNLELQTADATRMTIGNGFVDITGTLNLSNNNTNNTNKEGHLLARQYASGAETEGFQILQYFANSSLNRIDIGGAASTYNAATAINFYTAANTTTRTGTLALSIDSSQNSTFSGNVIADGFKTDTSNTDFNLLARNSSNTAVYIQNGGSGNILDVQSGSMSAGQGTSRFRVANDGDVFLGTSDYGDKLNVTGTGHFTGNVTLSRQTNDSGSTGLTFEKTRSTSVNGNTIVNSGDQLGYITFRGNDGDQFLDGAYILAFADSSPANNDMPTNLQFWTTGDGNSSPTERMRIAQDGRVGIGLGGANPSYMLHVNGGSNPAARFQQNNSTVQIAEFPANGGAVIWMDGSNGDLSGSDYFGIHALNATDLSFSADGGNIRITMKNDGKLGIGTTNPSEKLEVAGTALVENAKLKAIAESNTDTAVDVFIYDTRKDSDGGAWRKRTQHTSWYNETLNTATRGSRKEFPSVAVIVAEVSQVSIYDGDDPDMPMWMTFNGTNGYGSYLGRSNGANVTSVHMLNGNLCVGRGNSGYGEALLRANFISEHSVNYAVSGWRLIQPISGRDLDITSNAELNYSGINSIVNIAINDVAMTVLPNAPIDADSGLPVPTIAVATDNGISVIKDDGNVYDITNSGSSYNHWDTVKFTEDNKLIIQANNANTSNQLTHIVDIPTSDVNANNVNTIYSALNGRYYHGDSCTPRLSASSYRPKVVPLEQDKIAIGHNTSFTSDSGGLNLIAEEPSTQSGQTSTSMMAYIDDERNTGWFIGDAKIVALASTDDTDISSSGNTNILAGKNWTNNANFPYETLTTSGLDITSAINTTAYGAANLTWVSTPGRTYTAYFNMTLNSGTMPRCFMQTSSSFGNGLEFTPKNGANSFTFLASRSGSIYFSFSTNNGDATNYSVSGLELYEGGVTNHYKNPLVPNDHIGISVIGSVTKTPVATGAELVSYGGFSSSNYLYQPYSNAINFGTGDCSYTWWSKAFSSGTDRLWFSHGKYNTANSGLNILQYNSGGSGDEAHFYLGNAAAGYLVAYGIEHGSWECWTVTRKTGTMSLYRNGKLVGSVANNNAVSLGSATFGGLYIGTGLSGSSVFPYGVREIALFRLSRTATTAEQAARIYNDEKSLFQENAKATLYGSSESVTGLAYDDDTNLLHAGTSAGRSMFQGLRRVDNTTSAVGTVISVSNDMVVEE